MATNTQSELEKIQRELVKVRDEKQQFSDVEEEYMQHLARDGDADPVQDDYSRIQHRADSQENCQEEFKLETPEDFIKALFNKNEKIKRLLDQQIEINNELESMLKQEKEEKFRLNERLWTLRDEVRELKRQLLNSDLTLN